MLVEMHRLARRAARVTLWATVVGAVAAWLYHALPGVLALGRAALVCFAAVFASLPVLSAGLHLRGEWLVWAWVIGAASQVSLTILALGLLIAFVEPLTGVLVVSAVVYYAMLLAWKVVAVGRLVKSENGA